MQVHLQSLPNRSLSYAKIVQTERRTSSLLERYAEVQPILCKDSILCTSTWHFAAPILLIANKRPGVLPFRLYCDVYLLVVVTLPFLYLA